MSATESRAARKNIPGTRASRSANHHRPTTTLLTILGFAVLLSVFGGIRLRGLTLSAVGSALMAATFAVGSMRGGIVLPRLLAVSVASPFAVLAVMAGANLGRPITIGGFQQAVVWAGYAFAIVYAYNLNPAVDSWSLASRIDRTMEVASAVLIAVTAADAFVLPAQGVSPRIAALGALIPLCWFSGTWVGLRTRGGVFAVLLTGFVVMTLSRTAMAVALLVLIFGRPGASRALSARTAIRICAAVAVAALLVTRWKPLHNRFFSGDVTLNVGGLGINGMGRARIWGDLWATAWAEPLTGHGLGAARMRLESMHIGSDQPHQDYLRLFYEGGVITLAIFFAGVIAALAGLRALSQQRGGGNTPGFVRPAQLSLFVLLATALTDNTLVYAFIMFPCAILVGLGQRTGRLARSNTRSRHGGTA